MYCKKKKIVKSCDCVSIKPPTATLYTFKCNQLPSEVTLLVGWSPPVCNESVSINAPAPGNRVYYITKQHHEA